MLPAAVFEDDHLLVVHKPAGWNTHAPSPYAGEGLYDWLRHREPRWAALALIHRLDKETSGVLVLGKTRSANQGLTRQFEQRQVRKRYRLLTDRTVPFRERTVESAIVRVGERYQAGPAQGTRRAAVTRLVFQGTRHGYGEWTAEPETGLTHQIRVHAASVGLPILGDRLYGGTPDPGLGAGRLCLHAERLSCRHPVGDAALTFEVLADFTVDPRLQLRRSIIDPEETDAFRWLHGKADGTPGVYLDVLGEVLRMEQLPETGSGAVPLRDGPVGRWAAWAQVVGARAVLCQTRPKQRPAQGAATWQPRCVWGEAPAGPVVIRENGVRFEIRFDVGYSAGLFLDQRDNRRRLLVNHIGAGFPVRDGGLAGAEVLNTFAYTCGFSVCAARAGARTVNLDLSRNALDWGRRHFALNGLDAAAHEFRPGDVFEWLARWARQDRRFDVILLDPPTFSRSKSGGVFRATKDYGELVRRALLLLRPGGVLLASTNAAELRPEAFLETVRSSIQSLGRRLDREHYAPQPPDFPVSREEPAHLKTVWCRVQ